MLHDICILGSGPAAMAMVAACAHEGASVALVAPSPHACWPANYCLWADEVPVDLQTMTEKSWDRITVATTLGARTLERTYAKVSNQALQEHLWSMARSGHLCTVPEPAIRIEHRSDETRIETGTGSEVRARVVVDASGSRTQLVRRVHHRKPALQVAYGVLLEAPRHPFDPGCAVLMDFRPAAAGAGAPPSFLYALPLSENRLFLEETSLAHRPGVALEVLRARLELRLSALGLDRCVRLDEERCTIAMGLGLPALGLPLVPFGAAASMVHPASGYSIAHALRKAAPVARAIVEGLSTGDRALAIDSANATVWPHAQRAAWELYAFGLEALVRMDGSETARFFDAFFALPCDDWSGYLSGTLDPHALRAVMTRLFRRLPASVRWRLVRTGLHAGAAPLARTVLPSGAI